MGYIQSFIDKYKQKKQERNESCNALLNNINLAIANIDTLFDDKQNFIEPLKNDSWNKNNISLFNEISKRNFRNLKGAVQYKQLLERKEQLEEVKEDLPKRIRQHNNEVANNRIPQVYELIGNVEGRKLDIQQMTCVVKEAHNHLVIAGAGTGKTTTIVGKIKYLLKSEKCRPEDILVLSFTKASASDMCQRIRLETGADIKACTFHKLGIDIISEVDGVKPIVTQLDLEKFINEQLQEQMRSVDYLSLLSVYLLFNRGTLKSEFEFQTEAEYRDYLSMNPPTTINNEIVKSYGEMEIANFLTQNGIRYIYENPYEMDTRTDEYGQYYPDFYLPDYNIYIEYFGIDKAGNVPSYFKAQNGKSASEEYQASMKWKRQLHRKNHTTLVECFAYEKFDGTLLSALEKKLKEATVEMKPKTTEELWEQVSSEWERVQGGIVDLFNRLINLIKSNGCDVADVKRRNVPGVHYQSNHIILTLLEPIFNAYETYLKEQGEIDFNDMINLSAQYVQQGKFNSKYKYVIVDEYQDISKARFGLLNSLRQSRNFDLFCVGDDWQSIYCFNGSDIGYILNFEEYWGAAEISKIETTYRFPETLIEISGKFIMKNPLQIQKHIRGKKVDGGFPLEEISLFKEEQGSGVVIDKLKELPQRSTVFFIGRYSYDINFVTKSGRLETAYNNVEKKQELLCSERPDLKISFVTAHKSKGLEADYIFIINNKNTQKGFPSKIQDSPVLNLLLENYDDYPYAEERRLYYVSLTRAKKKVYFVTVNGLESVFALELQKEYGNELKSELLVCPKCGGRLLKRTGSHRDFFGCSNYSTKGCRYTRSVRSCGTGSKC